MSHEDTEEWLLEDHLRHGRTALSQILALELDSGVKPRTCFHFSPEVFDEREPFGETSSFCIAARPLFGKLPFELDVDYVGGTSGIEAWDDALPNEEWLVGRLESLMLLADQCALRFDGWSFEPRGGPIISISPTLEVFDGNTLPPISDDIVPTFSGVRDWLKTVTKK